MQDDRFFSDYAQATLIVRGTVKSVTRQGSDTVLELTSGVPTRVLCDLGADASGLTGGDTVKVIARSSDAERGSGTVVLKKCNVAP